MPNGATSKDSDSIQLSTPNLEAAYAVQNSWPTMPAVDEIATTKPERWARMAGSTARVTLTGPKKVVSICDLKSSGGPTRATGASVGIHRRGGGADCCPPPNPGALHTSG